MNKKEKRQFIRDYIRDCEYEYGKSTSCNICCHRNYCGMTNKLLIQPKTEM